MKSMKENEIKKLIKTIDTETAPPEGLKEKMLLNIVGTSDTKTVLTPFENFVFKKPLRTAFAVAAVTSGSFWLAMGKGFADFLNRIIG